MVKERNLSREKGNFQDLVLSLKENALILYAGWQPS